MISATTLTPLFAAVLICWILSVCVHEFAHALVAYLGGDKSVVAKGYLHFNIFAYIHPVTSILLPALFLFMGGVPLPGGAVYIDDRALRGPAWRSAVSAAGPAANFILFLILAAIVHPATGIVDSTSFVQPPWVMLLCTLTVLQVFAVLFNLLPIPPLDGFGIIEPYLPREIRERARSFGWMGLVLLYVVLFHSNVAMGHFQDMITSVLTRFGLPFENTWRHYNLVFFGTSD